MQTASSHGLDIRVQQARIEQLSDEETHSAGGLEVIHVGASVRIDSCQQRYDVGQVAEVIPVDHDPRGSRDRDEVQGVVG